MRVRLAGIDCPERGQDFGSRAKQFTSDMASRQRRGSHRFVAFFAQQPPATVLLEACGSAHYWARQSSHWATWCVSCRSHQH